MEEGRSKREERGKDGEQFGNSSNVSYYKFIREQWRKLRRRKEEEENMASKAIVTRKKRRRRTVNNDEEEKLRRTWSDLPQEILELIKKRLFFAGQLTFPAVCKSWSSINSFPPQKQIPWVIAFHENYGKFKMNTWSRCKLVDPTSNKTYNMDMKAMKEKKKMKDFNTVRVHESKYGWLLISSQYNQLTHSTKTSLFLFSPFYKEKNNLIELPDLDHGNTNIYFATFTSNPLEEDCLFLTVIAHQNGGTGIRTCRRGDESWSHWYSYFPVHKSLSWMYSEGIFYHIDDDYKMGIFNFARRRWSAIPQPPPTSSLSSEDSEPPPPLPTAENIYIVKADGEEELFLVYVPDLRDYFIRYIYRLDLSSMIWERVNSLGGNVLFIGDGYKSVLKPSEVKMKGISPDTVYYCGGSKLTCFSTVNRIHTKDGSHQDDSFDYGRSMATKSCRKIFIDPPPYHHYHH